MNTKNRSNKYLPKGLDIIHEDRDLIIINKPAGLLAVAAKYEKEETAHQLITNFYRKGSAHSRKELFPVNRIDRETSGLMLFAKSLPMREKMHEKWRHFSKTYLAVVKGQLADTSGVFQSYLQDDPKTYEVKSVKSPQHGKFARTRYEVLATGKRTSTVKVWLDTGRKNQIRVQFADAGHPLLGDEKYGGTSANRLALHSWQITFEHPFSGKSMTFEAPIPSFFTNYLPES